MTDNTQLRQVLPFIPVGRQVVAYDRRVKDISGLCMRLRRGNDKCFSCKTIPAGVLIQRVE